MSVLSWALTAREASAALARPADPMPKKVRLDTPSVPGLLSCCSLVRFSRATPGLVSFGSLIRVSPVIYLRASRSQGLRRRKFSGAQQLLFPMLVAQLRPSEERFSQKTEALAVPTWILFNFFGSAGKQSNGRDRT